MNINEFSIEYICRGINRAKIELIVRVIKVFGICSNIELIIN